MSIHGPLKKRPRWCFIAFIFACCISGGAGCDNIVNEFAFFPDTRNNLSTEQLPRGVEEIFIPAADDIRLQAYYLARPDSPTLLILFHGNAGNISYRLEDILRLQKCGAGVLAVSYRGYGKSSGTPSEQGLYADGAAALAYAVQDLGYDLDRIIILGRSIGTTVAVHTAMDQDIAGLILVTPLTSAKEHAKAHGMGLLAFLAGDAFDNFSKITRIRSPLLVIHGTRDEILPFAMGKAIFDRATTRKQFVVIENGGHNNLSHVRPDLYWGAIRTFITETALK
jgi:hypothetical protein